MDSTGKSTPGASGKKKAGTPRTPGEAFKRVDAEVWNKEVIEGLADNSCTYTYVRVFIYIYLRTSFQCASSRIFMTNM